LPLKYRKRDEQIRIASDAFYFEEGTAGAYEEAKYGEIKVDSYGECVLVGLRNEAKQRLPLDGSINMATSPGL
jgi:uncharacterized membrane-anchored protein